MRLSIFLFLIQIYSYALSVSYHGYKVYEIIPRNMEEVRYFEQLHEDKKYDFWSIHRVANIPITVMVGSKEQTIFENNLRQNGLEYTITIEDVEKAIGSSNGINPDSLSAGEVSFTKFMEHDEINAYLANLSRTYSNVVTTEVIGQSYEGRNITLVKISSGGINKPTVFSDAAIHAREWMAPSVALYIINQLVENPEYSNMYENVDWVILPVANPDGYQYTFTTDRLWRKTRSPGSRCYGADANRNFGFHWGESGSSSDQCEEIYAGKSAFSEPETQAMRDYFSKQGSNIKLYVALHSYGPWIIYPWSYDYILADNAEELQDLGDAVNAAIESVNGTNYTVGNSANLLYTAAGCSDDYAKGVTGVDLVFVIELPGGGSDGFNPPASRDTTYGGGDMGRLQGPSSIC